jgi:hypothetical protein
MHAVKTKGLESVGVDHSLNQGPQMEPVRPDLFDDANHLFVHRRGFGLGRLWQANLWMLGQLQAIPVDLRGMFTDSVG